MNYKVYKDTTFRDLRGFFSQTAFDISEFTFQILESLSPVPVTEMDSDSNMETKKPAIVDAKNSVDDYCSGEAGPLIYIAPVKEAACRKKFDKYVVPVSVIFLVLSTLARNNVSKPPFIQILLLLTIDQLGNARVFGFDQDIGLHGGQFGNINTLSSVCTILFEVPWVLAVRHWGANKSIGTAFVL